MTNLKAETKSKTKSNWKGVLKEYAIQTGIIALQGIVMGIAGGVGNELYGKIRSPKTLENTNGNVLKLHQTA